MIIYVKEIILFSIINIGEENKKIKNIDLKNSVKISFG
jgi:hypothetical protein